MELKRELLKELVKKGVAVKEGKRIWNLADRRLLFLTPELSEGFLRLREHPRYKEIVIEKELSLIRENFDMINEAIGEGPVNLIDVGCGNGMKAKEILSKLDNSKSVRFVPVSASKHLVDLTTKNIKEGNFDMVKELSPQVAPLDELDKVVSLARNGDFNRNFIFILGSIIANYDINDYLFKLSNYMFKGDCILIGNGIRRGERLVNLENYKNPLFNEWFISLVKALGFEDSEVEYEVRFNKMRVEGFYKVKIDKEFDFEGKKIEIKKGDEILVATLYKFYEQELKEFCEMYFQDVKMFKDKDEEYSLLICKK